MTKYGRLHTELLDKQLDDFLNSCNVKETEDVKVERAQVIAQLSKIVKRWIKEVALARGISDAEPNARIFPVGSYVFDEKFHVLFWFNTYNDVLCVGSNYFHEVSIE
ncbi:hypothetical protein SUGI_0222070 [Cryptomeria japonica]|nr:hypothetical protein SUGI_0222070 [Cryptomeria japonica]